MRRLRKRLLERAEGSLEAARWLLERGDTDLALVLAEQAAQFRIKAAQILLTGEHARGHDLRELLGVLRDVTGDERIDEFVREHAKALDVLDVAYTECRYGAWKPSKETVEWAIETTEELFELLERLEEDHGPE
ncbi:MAG: HEPN domain-containing protein [Euryarchaeota archaeon]